MSETLQPGRYLVRVVGGCLGESSSGNPQIEFGLKPLQFFDPEGGGQPVPISASTQIMYCAVTEGTMGTVSEPGWLVRLLLDLGVRGELSDKALQATKGQEREAILTYETYEGKERPRWNIYPERGTTAYRPLDRKKQASLNSKFGGLLKKLGSELPTPQTTSTRPMSGPKEWQKTRPQKKEDSDEDTDEDTDLGDKPIPF